MPTAKPVGTVPQPKAKFDVKPTLELPLPKAVATLKPKFGVPPIQGECEYETDVAIALD